MDTGRLYTILQIVKNDYQSLNIIKKLNRVVDALNNQINQSNEANQKSLIASWDDLRQTLKLSELLKIPKTWRAPVEQLGLTYFIGCGLSARIDSIDLDKTLLVSVRDEIVQIREKINQVLDKSGKITESFEYFHITGSQLEPGEAEVSVLIPRAAIDSELGKLANEVRTFDRIFRLLSEIATGSREDVKIKQISTSDPLFLLCVSPSVGLSIILVVDRILDVIIKTQKVRAVRAQAAAAEVDVQILESLERAVKAQVDKGLVDVEEFILRRYASRLVADEGRKHEVRIELKNALKVLAERIDNGYQVDADARAPESDILSESDKPVDDKSKEIEALRQQVEELKSIAQKVQYLEIPSEPVLQLTASEAKIDNSLDDNSAGSTSD